MPHFPILHPARIGIDPARLGAAGSLLATWKESGAVPASALCMGRGGGMAEPIVVGAADDALWLVASLTKPVVALATMLLVERGQLTLDTPAAEFIPLLGSNGKESIRIRHLLTHTSGLPDQLPQNLALRASHASLDDFVRETCAVEPLFPPGTGVRYQSMGFALLGAILERIVGEPLGPFLRREIFEPLGMRDTWLGLPEPEHGRVVPVWLDPDPDQRTAGDDWSWNSAYWRLLGAPWGGLVTTPGDFARFCRMTLDEGRLGRTRIAAPATIRAMIGNRLDDFPGIAEEVRRCRSWGLGWRRQWPGHPSTFGDLVGTLAVGHYGATGTLAWLDPQTDAFCLIFTTLPTAGDDQSLLTRASNAAAAALA